MGNFLIIITEKVGLYFFSVSQSHNTMLMIERRKHQRVAFASPPNAHFGQFGIKGKGYLQNISLGGLLLKTDSELKVGEPLGCEFILANEHLIDIPAIVANKIQSHYGIRFQAGLVSQWLIQEAIDTMLTSGRGSILSIKDLGGRRVMHAQLPLVYSGAIYTNPING